MVLDKKGRLTDGQLPQTGFQGVQAVGIRQGLPLIQAPTTEEAQPSSLRCAPLSASWPLLLSL